MSQDQSFERGARSVAASGCAHRCSTRTACAPHAHPSPPPTKREVHRAEYTATKDKYTAPKGTGERPFQGNGFP
eukprot:1267513-Pleurochrysis_carterae.AAC.2